MGRSVKFDNDIFLDASAVKNIVKSVTKTAVTTSTGAFLMPSIVHPGHSTTLVRIAPVPPSIGIAIHRGDGYCTVFNYDLTIKANTEITLEFFYIDNN